VVALGTAAAMPDGKPDPASLAASNASLSGGAGAGAAAPDRQSGTSRASRSDTRTAATALSTVDQFAPDIWLLPLKNYAVSSPFGQRWGTLHPGVDLAASEGTPYYATHSGVVKLARYNGGYGYCVMLDAGNGVTLVYGHSSRLLVHEGQQVQAGDMLGLVGNTGYSFGDHLHYEVRQNGNSVDPVPFMLAHGVDIGKKTQAVDN
jgi:murein DD-endopeptidase MepM/ murein hydrolase activator NlpD